MKDIRHYENEYAITENGEIYCYALGMVLNTVRRPEGYIRRIYSTERGKKVCIDIEVYLPLKHPRGRTKYDQKSVIYLMKQAYFGKAPGCILVYKNGDARDSSVNNLVWKEI